MSSAQTSSNNPLSGVPSTAIESHVGFIEARKAGAEAQRNAEAALKQYVDVLAESVWAAIKDQVAVEMRWAMLMPPEGFKATPQKTPPDPVGQPQVKWSPVNFNKSPRPTVPDALRPEMARLTMEKIIERLEPRIGGSAESAWESLLHGAVQVPASVPPSMPSPGDQGPGIK